MLRKEVKLTMFNKFKSTNRGVLSDLDLKILWVSRTLSDIDSHYDPEFIRIGRSPIHRDLKKVMRDALIATYRKKRAPYLKMLTELRNKQRQFPC
jgi:hypothetical protein